MKLQPAAGPQRFENRGQARQRLRGVAPIARVDQEPLPDELGLLSDADGQRGAQLQPGGIGSLLDAELGKKRRRARQKQRANLGRREARELRLVAVDEPPAAPRAALRGDGHAGRAERIHVAEDRSLRDLEPARK